MDSSDTGQSSQRSPDFYQNVIVMRHGDRIDFIDRSWRATATRPWDPPLIDDGLARAFKTGQTIRNDLGLPIHRVFVSPFLRCVQTASRVVSALCAVEDETIAVTGNSASISPSKLMVSIEYGLCEGLDSNAITPDVAPKDGNWGFDIAGLEAILPAGSMDQSVERVYQEMPQWEETATAIESRFQQTFQTLADKYISENILLITHAIGVGIVASPFLKDARVLHVGYCGCAKLRRPVFREDNSFVAGNFEMLSVNDTNGIRYSTSADE